MLNSRRDICNSYQREVFWTILVWSILLGFPFAVLIYVLIACVNHER